MTIRRADDSLRYRPFGRRHIDRLSWLENLSRDQVLALKAVSAVLPFRVNRYVLDELIDWNNIPSDPIYQLVFPQVGMLARNDFNRMLDLVVDGAAEEESRPCGTGHPDGNESTPVGSIGAQRPQGRR